MKLGFPQQRLTFWIATLRSVTLVQSQPPAGLTAVQLRSQPPPELSRNVTGPERTPVVSPRTLKSSWIACGSEVLPCHRTQMLTVLIGPTTAGFAISHHPQSPFGSAAMSSRLATLPSSARTLFGFLASVPVQGPPGPTQAVLSPYPEASSVCELHGTGVGVKVSPTGVGVAVSAPIGVGEGTGGKGQ